VGVTREQSTPAWTSFRFAARGEDTAWPGSGPVQDRLAEFVQRQAARLGVIAGSMTDDISPGGHTALERALHRGFRPLGGDLREVLRGYTWVTILAPELAARLGGAGALAASGAFAEVTELPNGALWLRATRTIDEFTGDRVRRVFEELAPVLLTGNAKLEYNGEIYRIVEDVDAADYR